MNRLTESGIVDILRRGFAISDGLTGSEWSLLTQVEVLGRRLDAVVMHRDTGTISAYEIKTSRADYRNETPDKRSAAEAVAHFCYYVTPIGLLRDVPLPERWGLVEVDTTTNVIPEPFAVPRTYNSAVPVTSLMAAVFARASDDAEAIRRAETPATDLVALQRRVEALVGQVGTARAAAAREKRRGDVARSCLLSVDGVQECGACGEAVEYVHTMRPQPGWRHTNATQETRCRKARSEAARLAQEKRTGARYLSGDPGPVVPRAFTT